jgi:hypothetical protein
MPYPLLATGTDVADAATGYIEAYDAVIDALVATKQLDADSIQQLRGLSTSMAADLAVLATVTNAA